MQQRSSNLARYAPRKHGPVVFARLTSRCRIRDNQRRSRARRKEYLQELETRYRQCEQTGVEASAEIQAAARKVVDENRRLRELLRSKCSDDVRLDGSLLWVWEADDTPTIVEHGLSDVEIDSGPSEARDNNISNELESMISVRRRCGSGGCDDGSSCEPSSDATAGSTTPLSARRSPNPSHPPTNKPATTFPQGMPLPVSLGLNTLPAVEPPLSYTSSDYSLPSLNYYDGHTHHLVSHNIPALSHSGSSMGSSTRTASDAEMLASQQEFDMQMEQESCCGGGVQCRVPDDCIYKIMEQYSQRS